MKKNVYVEPAMFVVEVQLQQLMSESKFTQIGGGTFKKNVEAGDGTGNSTPRGSEWFGEDEEYEEDW